jgi:hypothetical protein
MLQLHRVFVLGEYIFALPFQKSSASSHHQRKRQTAQPCAVGVEAQPRQ